MLSPARVRIVRPVVRVLVSVTAWHIATATRDHCVNDPIARAFRPLIRDDYDAIVGFLRVEFVPLANPRTGYACATLPEPARTFLRAWDAKYPVTPLAFEVEVPKFVLAKGEVI